MSEKKIIRIILIAVFGFLNIGAACFQFVKPLQELLLKNGALIAGKELDIPVWMDRFKGIFIVLDMLLISTVLCTVIMIIYCVIMERRNKVTDALSEVKSVQNTDDVNGLLILLISAVFSWFMLEISSFGSPKLFYEAGFLHEPQFLLLNIFTIMMILGLLYLIIRRLWIALLVGDIFWGLLAISNSYVIRYHQAPLSFLELKNAGTALNVISGYDFTPDKYVIAILLLLALQLSMLYFVKKYRLEIYENKKKIRAAIIAGFAVFVVIIGYVAPFSIKPHSTIGWVWMDSYQRYGYLACVIESFGHAIKNPVQKPDNYDEKEVQRLLNEATNRDINRDVNRGVNKDINIDVNTDAGSVSNNAALQVNESSPEKPDIILVLNETFFDLKQVCSLETDQDYLRNYNMAKGSKGYAIVPGLGGETNASEYELLTGNSLRMMPGITPFQRLNMKGAKSVVSELEAIGYTTLGIHPGPAENYARINGYPGLGFDEYHFLEDFNNQKWLRCKAYLSDECTFDNLIEWYEQMGDGPRFAYALTIQNHGDYNLQEDSEDIVHASGNFGENTSIVNEYLSSIKHSDEALGELLEYVQNSDRKIIFCMVGDHSPAFINDVADDAYMQENGDLKKRGTPFIIVSNYMDFDENIGYLGINELMPYVLRKAQLPLSGYMNYAASMRESYPVIGTVCYADAEGNVYAYGDKEELPEKLQEYFKVEYWHITDRAGFK